MADQSSRPINLFVFDFDHTVIDDNSDTCFYPIFPNGKCPEDLAALYEEKQWTKFMNDTTSYLWNVMKVTPEQIQKEIQKCTLVPGMLDLFQKINQNGDEIIICSDANSLFINWILESQDLGKYISAVYTNPAKIENNQIVISRFQESHTCQLCTGTPNMCKSISIQNHLNKSSKNYSGNIHYFGDGGNDFCPIVKMLQNEKSSGNVRTGFALERVIKSHAEKQNGLQSKGTLRYWKTALDLLPHF